MKNTEITTAKEKKTARSGNLAGMQLFISDNIAIKGQPFSCGSLLLQDFIAPYNACLVNQLEQAGAVLAIHTCETEFPIGGIIYACKKNNVCYTLKTSYGHINRYGLASVVPSIETIDIAAASLQDIRRILEVLETPDEHSAGTADEQLETPTVKADKHSVDKFPGAGTAKTLVLTEKVLSLLEMLYPLLYAETASSLARLDGIRYGTRLDPGTGFDDVYIASREAGFTAKTKKRIILGNYILSKTFSGNFYEKLSNARAVLEQMVSNALPENGYAFIDPKQTNPVLLAQLARLPLLIISCNTTENQESGTRYLLGKHKSEHVLLNYASKMEVVQ